MQKSRVIVLWVFLTFSLPTTLNAQYASCPFAQLKNGLHNVVIASAAAPIPAGPYAPPHNSNSIPEYDAQYSTAQTFSSLINGYLNGGGIEPYISNDDQLLSDNMLLKSYSNEGNANGLPKCANPPADCADDTANYYYRSIDGSCNNLRFPGLGMAGSRYGRLLPPNYSQNGRPTVSKNGQPMPGARLLSLSLFDDSLIPDPIRTFSTMQIGQFVAHDMSSQSTAGAPDDCCAYANNEKCYPISLVPNGPIARGTNKQCLSFSRANTEKDAKCENNAYYPEKVTTVSAYLDMSSIYGNSKEENEKVRQYSGGLLKTSFISNRQWLPLSNNEDGACGKESLKCFNIPDRRNQFVPTVIVLQTMFLREHNRIACALANLNPHYSDEKLYQEARKINIAQYQHIVYYEWLPAVLGASYAYVSRLMHNVQTGEYVNDYNDSVDPAPYAESAAGAFRFGHTQVPGFFSLVASNHVLNATKRLSDFFENPSNIDFVTSGEVFDAVVLGMATQPQKQADNSIDKELKHYFNRKRNEKFGGDLKSMDIKRGRDFGLPSYNDLREYCGLPRAYVWADFAPEISYEKIESLQNLYSSPDDVELNTGGALETLLPGSLFGPTFQCIMEKQFLRTRISDRFFYENENMFSGFRRDQLAEIRKASLAALYCNNGDYIQYMQSNAFIIPNPNNVLKSCSVLPQVDLTKWRALPQ